jgi:hypothetical protein
MLWRVFLFAGVVVVVLTAITSSQHITIMSGSFTLN